MGMLASDHEENITHWKDQIRFFADKCYKNLPIVSANTDILKLRAK
jgi:hypothetical protein